MTESAATIPAFFAVDVEPDGFQAPSDLNRAWSGYEAMFAYVETLRARLAERSGVEPVLGWYFRTDPQIAALFGRNDYALAAYPERLAHIEARRDYLGVHIHPIRWCERRRLWVHDFADPVFAVRCVREALEAFAAAVGTPARRARLGANYISDEALAALEEHGVEVELKLEPVGRLDLYRRVPSAIDSTPVLGYRRNCGGAPLGAYRPSQRDFRVADNDTGRDLVLIPINTGPEILPRPAWRRYARRLWLGAGAADVFYPDAPWPNPTAYWDLVERQLDSMERPFFNMGLRTDAPHTDLTDRLRRVFDELPRHALSRRLRFVDPVEAAPGLLMSDPRRGTARLDAPRGSS